MKERRESRPRAEQKIPKDHWDTDGLSRGKQTGPVRKSPDACNGRGRRNEK